MQEESLLVATLSNFDIFIRSKDIHSPILKSSEIVPNFARLLDQIFFGGTAPYFSSLMHKA